MMISKSDYTSALQCERMLWLRKNMPEEADESYANSAAATGGDEVGALARAYYGPDFVLIENDFDYERMARETREALDAGKTVCEACFMADDLVCLADIVRPVGGGLELTEVKSTTKAKPHQYDDVAFQAYVMERAGFRPKACHLLHIDGAYVREGELNLRELFACEDVTEEVRGRIAGTVPAAIDAARAAASAAGEPRCSIGKHCNSPHPCLFQGRCWADVPADSVFSMAGMGRVRGWKWWNKGVRTPEQVAEAMRTGEMSENVLRARQCDGEYHADRAALTAFLEKNVSWPVYHLDFETFQSPIPRWDGVKPYQQVTSQFSIHIQDAPALISRHLEFLAEAGPDPRRAVALALVEAIPQGACVAAYNMSFERGRIRELADACPDLKDRLMGIHDAIIDLMVPFQKGWLYNPAMGSSYSIKAVLPAFFPGDSGLDYHALPTVHNGAQAAAAYLALEGLPPDELERAREGLLRYCELDTLAMVKVLDAIVACAS